MFDFAICEAERIDCPGVVQSHGHLFALDVRDLVVINFSAGSAAILNVDGADLLNMDLARLSEILALPIAAQSTVRAMAAKISQKAGRIQPIPLGRFRAFNIMASAGMDCVLIEARIEPPETLSELEVAAWAMHFEEEISEPSQSLFKLSQTSANAIWDLTGFDRVMIYRFHSDWTGEVVAEARRDALVPFLGLRYPATDIPSQARKLYTETLIREISDTAHRPVPLALPAGSQSVRPIDLAPAILREVSPYHVEYLNNMGVRATLVSSIIAGGKLWGLVSCHHHQPKHVSMAIRAAVLRASDRMGSAIDTILDAESTRRSNTALRQINEIRSNLSTDPRAIDRLLTAFRDTARADGAALVIDDHVVAVGDAPPSVRVPALVAGLNSMEVGTVLSAESISDFGINLEATQLPSMGAAIVRLINGRFAFLIAFRNELTREVLWGGDPSQAAEVDLATGKLSPRRSFATWREIVRGRCRPWGPDTLKNIQQFATIEIEQDALKAGARKIGARLRAPDALRTAIMDILPGALILSVGIDPEGSVRAALSNSAYHATFGFTPDELEGLSVQALLRKMGASAADIEKSKTLGNRDIEVTVWSRTKGEMNIRLSRHSILDSAMPSRNETWHMLSFQDITEFRRNERALKIAHDQSNLRLRGQQNTDIGAGEAMGFPLNAVAAYAQILAGGLVEPRTLSEQLDQAENQATNNHTRALLDDLLTSAQLVAGDRRLMMSQFDVVSLAFDVLDWIKLWFDGPMPPVEIHHPVGALPITADSRAVRQILINLIGNAAKASQSDGLIRVDISQDPNRRTLIEVRDTGQGRAHDLAQSSVPIAELAIMPQIRAGLSFGMAMVVGLVELHKGTLVISTLADDGSSSGTRVQIGLPNPT
jgi:light-regulated signal transduction histidine kinase (bacteriophytochrome)